MMMRKISLTFFCYLIICLAYAQKNELVANTDGATGYLIHKVAAKENYYSIGRIYNISPKEFAPFNGIQLNQALSIGQNIKIPLMAQNFFTKYNNTTNEIMIPVYYTTTEKISVEKLAKKFGIADINSIKTNNSEGNSINAGKKIVIGFLKVIKDQSPLAMNAPKFIEPKIVEDEEVVKKPVKSTNEIIQQKIGEKAPISNTEPVKNDFPTKEAEVKENKISNNHTGGYFKNEFDVQTGNGKNIQSLKVTGNIFRTESGAAESKYYILMNGVQKGTIVKIMYNKKYVYAKVLDALPEMKENNGLQFRISSVAALVLQVPNQNFEAEISWSK